MWPGISSAGSIFNNNLRIILSHSQNDVTGAGITSGQMVNETSFYIDDIKALKDGAIDPYISFREFYHQNRENLIDD